MSIGQYSGRVGIQQRVLTRYRAPVFEELCRRIEGGLSICAGTPRPLDNAQWTTEVAGAEYAPARNLHMLREPLYVCYQRNLMKWLRAWNPDVLIAEANPRQIATRFARRWMHKRGRPVIGWGLGVMSLSSGYEGLRHRGRTQFIRGFDAMIAYSTKAADDYEQVGVPREKIFVAYNACTHKPDAPPPPRNKPVDGRYTLLFVGRINPGKRVPKLIEAVAKLPKERRPHLKIVGDGDSLDEVRSTAAKILPESQILGAKYGDELIDLFQSADLFVLPGLGGLAVQQAMSHGLPVIVAEGDGTQADLVRPGSGWNVTPGDADELAALIDDALSEPKRLRDMGREAYRIVAEEVNIEAMADTFVRALQSVT